MLQKGLQSLLALAFSLFLTVFSTSAFASGEPGTEGHGEHGSRKLNMKKVIFGHIGNGHDFHFFSTFDAAGKEHPVSLPLPVILYSSCLQNLSTVIQK
jgi:F-type H+-transporting ATPase subunit a